MTVVLDMEFDAGYIVVSWIPPFDNYSTIANYTLQLGEWNDFSESVIFEDTTSSPLSGSVNNTKISFVYGSTYYFRLSATNTQGQSNVSAAESVLCADVPLPPTKLIFTNQADSSSSNSNMTLLGIKWTSNSVASGDSLTYSLQAAVGSGDWVCSLIE